MLPDQPPLNIYLFGDLRIFRGDDPIPSLSSVRAQSLLAYLVLHAGVPQSRRHLAFLLWPDSSDEQSRSNLRKLLHDLRRALPEVEEYLDAEGPNLLWRGEGRFSVDVAEFEQKVRTAQSAKELEQAVGLYQGPLFQSCYDDWVLPERERLQQMFVDTLGRLIEGLENAGEYRSAIQYAQLLLQHDPLHEDVYRSLMRLYALNDDRAAALRTYQTCAAVLQKELDVEPSAATKQAYERLLNLKAAGVRVVNAPTPLVGHSREWARLQGVWREVTKGGPHWVVLTGAAGIGKTRLAEELLNWAGKQGIVSASARCYAAERGLGYGPIATWLRGRELESLEKVWRVEVARLLPELLVHDPELGVPGPLTEAWQRLRFFEGLARAMLESQPVILLLDDLQYCDRDTLEWLHYLLRFNAQASLLVVSTLCLEEVKAETGLPGILQTLRRAGQLTEIGVQPLSAEETAELAAQVEGGPVETAAVERLYRETEGNPLFVVEMVRAGRLKGTGEPGSLPRTMEAVIAGRLGQLSERTQALVKVAAVLGREFRVDLLGRASGVSEEELGQGLAELRQKRIVRMPQGGLYDFDHSQLQQVAYGGMNIAERQRLHRHVAEALEELEQSGRESGWSGEIVRHYEAAGLGERAVPYQVRAGDQARWRYANATAIRYYEAALPHLSDPERPEVMIRLAKVHELIGHWSQAETLYRQGIELSTCLGDVCGLAHCEMAYGELLHRKGRDEQALGWIGRARDRFEELGDAISLGRALQGLGVLYDFRGDAPRALAFHQQRLAIAWKEQDRRGISQSLGYIGLIYWRQGQLERALELYERQLAMARELNDQREIARAYEHQGLLFAERGEHGRALDVFERALEGATKTGDRPMQGYLAGHIGRVYHAQGEFIRALEQYQRQHEIMSELESRRGISYALRDMGSLYQQIGSLADAKMCYTGCLQLAQEMHDTRLASYATAHLAEILAGEQEESLALRMLDQSILLSRAMNMPYYLGEQLYQSACLNFKLHCYSDAERQAGEALSLARRMGREELEFHARVLWIQARAATNKFGRVRAAQELEELLGRQEEEERKAAIQHALTTVASSTRQKKAARPRRGLHKPVSRQDQQSGNLERIGGTHQPELRLPGPPVSFPENPKGLDGLIAELEQFAGAVTQPVRP